MSDHEITRIANYIAGEGSPEERAEIARWIASSAERTALLNALQENWSSAERPQIVVDVDARWKELDNRHTARSRGAASSNRTEPSPRVLTLTPSRPHSVWLNVARWAAAIILIAGSASLATRLLFRPHPSIPTSAPMREVATARAQRASVTLADSSRVLLGAASTLRFVEGFGGARREVYLDGDALFEVRHDPMRPFVVHSTHGATTDLGTVFVVRDYRDDQAMTVAVREGRVGLRASHAVARDVILNAGDSRQANANGEVSETGRPTADFFAWTEGRLIFHDTPLKEVAAAMERWYDVDVAVASGAERRTVSATFDDERLDTVLRLIATATDVQVVRRGKTYTLTPTLEKR